jgi:hypothetical protein
MTVVHLEPLWPKIIDYYWDNLDPATDGSVWDWLEHDYHATRTIRNKLHFQAGRRFDLYFENDKDATMFLLRWT